jgi:plasmid maintenance system antidote protein VapI
VIAGRYAISPEMAVRLEKALGSTADTWLGMQMNYDLAQIQAKACRLRSRGWLRREPAQHVDNSTCHRVDMSSHGNKAASDAPTVNVAYK